MQQEVGAPPGDSTNAKLLNQNMSGLIQALGAGSSSTVAKLMEIAAAITASIIGGTTGANADRILTAKGTTGRALQPSVASIDGSGNVTGVANLNMSGDLVCDDITADDIGADDIAAQDGAFSSTLTKGGVSVAVVNQTGGASFVFSEPEDGTVRLLINWPFAFTVTSTTTRTRAGTATCTFSINGTPLGGTANSASTTEQTQSHSSANVVSVGADLEVAFSSTASCEYLSITVASTYVLA